VSARLPVPDRASLPPETSELLALTEVDGQAPVTIELLAHSSTLLSPFLGWAAALALRGALSSRDHEVLALRISHLCGSEFEWEEHRLFARRAGMTDSDIAAIASHPDGDLLRDPDLALVDAADELHRSGRVTDATFDRLSRWFRPEQLVEIPMVVGQYAMLSMLCGFAGVASGRTDGRRSGSDELPGGHG
jgi:alkylhydroperoxidase family enzyme